MDLSAPVSQPTPPVLFHQIGHERAHLIPLSRESLPLSGQLLTQ